MATAKDPELLVGSACATGSARTHPWMLFEDLNGDGYFDHVTVGLCDGSTSARDFDVMPLDPWQLAPGDTAVGGLPPNVICNAVALHDVHMPSSGTMFAWTLTESYQGTPICSCGRSDAGAFSTSCPPQ